MTAEPVARRADALRLASKIIGIGVAVEGCLVLAGWAFDVEILKSVLPGFSTMKPNTALAFVLLGLIIRQDAVAPRAGPAPRYLSIPALAVSVLGLLTLLEHVGDVNLRIDSLLFERSVLAEQPSEPGRMAPLTAASLLLLGIALWLSRQAGFWNRLAEAMALAVALVALIALTGYLYGVQYLYAVTGDTPMAFPTAAALLLLSLGLLAAHPERGLTAIVVSNGPGGRAARRLVPAAVAFPLLLGWLRLAGERAALYDTSFGVSLLVLILVAVFSGVILWNARSLDRIEAERQLAEEATREKSRFLQLILDRMSDGVIVADAHGHFLLFNRAAEDLLGMGAAEVGPGSWAEHFGILLEDGATPFPSLELPLARAIRGEEVSDVELVSRHTGRPNGVWLRVSARPLQDPQGVLQGGLAMFSDVTERRRLDQARQRALEMEEANRRAEDTSRLKSEFLANMSHELRTPLNAIIGFAEILHDEKAGPVEPEQREFLGDILTSSRHLLQLINDVLDLSKIEAGKIEIDPEALDPVQVATEVRDLLRGLGAASRVMVSVESTGQLGEVVVDRAKLKQVLYNYLSNALKFTPEGGSVTVRLAPEGADSFRVEVEDSGIGIRPEELRRLFVEFQQLDSTTAKKYPGTGLGLALTKRIVEAQGGRVGVRSRPGEGSVFFAVLPRAGVATRERTGWVATREVSIPGVGGGRAEEAPT